MPHATEPVINTNNILNQILSENPGLAKVFNTNNTQIIFASPERKKIGEQMGGLEYWPADEPGYKGWEHPTGGGKNVIEIYSDELKNNPKKLYNAVWGDMLHGMVKDPYYNTLREEFKKNYTPEESARIQSKRSWWDDANGENANDMAINDSYIRGALNEPDVAEQGQEFYGNTMYSPKQIQILNMMKNYLRTGK